MDGTIGAITRGYSVVSYDLGKMRMMFRVCEECGHANILFGCECSAARCRCAWKRRQAHGATD